MKKSLSMNFTSGTAERVQVRPPSDVLANWLVVPSNSLPNPTRELMNCMFWMKCSDNILQ